MKNYSFAILLVILLSSCAAIKDNVPVTEPIDGAMAKVRIAIPSSGNGRNVIAYPDSVCAGRRVPGSGRVLSNFVISFEKTLNDKKIGMPETVLSRNGDFIKSEIYVRAGRPFTLETFRVPTQTGSISTVTTTGRLASIPVMTTWLIADGCNNKVTFTPEENGEYEIIFGEDRMTCAASVNQMVQKNLEVSLFPLQVSQATECAKKR